MKNRRILKKSILCLLGLVMTFSLAGCGGKKQEQETVVVTKSSPADKTVAIHAGENNVFLDEARYYAYTAQATYETYYLSEEKELNWSGAMKDEVTWEQGVKSLVLDDICRRECMYALAGEYNVSLSEEEESGIDKQVKSYYENTSRILMNKIDIDEKRLKYVFEKKLIAGKVEDIMTASDEKLPDKTYENWKSGNTVTAEEQWKSITFNKPIFTLEDVQ